MAMTSWLQGVKGSLDRNGGASRPRPHRRAVTRRRSCRPRLEALDDRTLLSTFTVLNLNDSGIGSLRAAIAASNADTGANTIAFAKGLKGTIALTSGELSITNSVTINGPGANELSVSGQSVSRVFEIGAGLNVTIGGLTVSHGHAPDQGGGILNDGSNLTLSGDDLSQNVAFESTTTIALGGALQSLGGISTGLERMPDRRRPGAAGDGRVGGRGRSAGGGISARCRQGHQVSGKNISSGTWPGGGAPEQPRSVPAVGAIDLLVALVGSPAARSVARTRPNRRCRQR